MDSRALERQLQELKDRKLYRSRRVVQSPQGALVTCNGRKLINFCSNDYLGLANHPQVVEALKKGADEWGVGSGSAHLICGHSKAHHALEEELAEFTGRDRVLLFSTGYMANLGAISALVGKGDWILEDRLNHASLLDGGLLSGARFQRYQHTDISALIQCLDGARDKPTWIVTDGVFSMDGDIAPLPDLVRVSKEAGAGLIVDDAHGLGVLGEQGRGTVEYHQLQQDDVPVLVGTLGKAFGTFGAFVAGNDVLIETIIQRARTYIYTTAVPHAIAEATRASLRLVASEAWRREKLTSLINQFRMGAEQLGLALTDSLTPIQPILVGDSHRAGRLSDRLQSLGFLISAIRPPTVPDGTARLRITFSALHQEQQVDLLLEALADTTKEDVQDPSTINR